MLIGGIWSTLRSSWVASEWELGPWGMDWQVQKVKEISGMPFNLRGEVPSRRCNGMCRAITILQAKPIILCFSWPCPVFQA